MATPSPQFRPKIQKKLTVLASGFKGLSVKGHPLLDILANDASFFSISPKSSFKKQMDSNRIILRTGCLISSKL